MDDKTKSYIEKIEMTHAQAEDMVAHVVTEKLRWEQQYDASDIGSKKLAEALVLIAFHENSEMKDIRESLATANRQIGAFNAREARDKNYKEKLKQEIANLESLLEQQVEKNEKLAEHNNSLTGDILDLRDQIDELDGEIAARGENNDA